MNRLALSSLLAFTACGSATIDPPPFPAPSELMVYQLGIGLHLTWKDNSLDEDEFQIERKSNGGFATPTAMPQLRLQWLWRGLVVVAAPMTRVRVAAAEVVQPVVVVVVRATCLPRA